MSGSVSIMDFSQDLSTQEAPPPLPVGQYPGEIVACVFKTSATSGNTYAAVSFRIAPEQYPADFVDGDPDGMVLTYNRLVMEDTPQARWRVRNFLEAVGGKLGRSFDPTDVLGLTGVLDIEHNEYEGEKRAQIKRVVKA